MYIDYSNLWKQMAEKGISKSDLIQLTGLSSRVVAKLAKNQTVTTDTIARICCALSCEVGDVMAYSHEDTLSLFGAFRTLGTVTEENEQVKKVTFELNGQKYVVYTSKKAATKATCLYCAADGSLYWEQAYKVGWPGSPVMEKEHLVRPERGVDEITIVVIKGNPGGFVGLDEGIWVSAKRGRLKGEHDVFVMSEAVFKVFEPQNN